MRKDPETIVREEVRAWLAGNVSEATVARDIITVLDSKPPHEARVFAARLSDAALDYLVATEQAAAAAEPPLDPDPGPAAPDGPLPDPEPAPVDAVAETSPAEPSEEAA